MIRATKLRLFSVGLIDSQIICYSRSIYFPSVLEGMDIEFDGTFVAREQNQNHSAEYAIFYGMRNYIVLHVQHMMFVKLPYHALI